MLKSLHANWFQFSQYKFQNKQIGINEWKKVFRIKILIKVRTLKNYVVKNLMIEWVYSSLLEWGDMPQKQYLGWQSQKGEKR